MNKLLQPSGAFPLKYLFLLALVSYPVAGAMQNDRQITDRMSEVKTAATVLPPAEVSLVTVNHSRILNTFDADGYFPGYQLTAQPKASFSGQPTSIESYRKVQQEWVVPVDQIATFSANHYGAQAPLKTAPMYKYETVGFPHIETSGRSQNSQYKPFFPLLKIRETGDGVRKIVANIACFGYSPESTARRAERFEAPIVRLSKRYKISPHLVKAVIAQESCFRKNATSHVGAQGLMQLMPETATWLGVKDSLDPEQNLRAGIRYLSQLKRRFGSTDLALAAYNAGPGNVERYKGIPPFAETKTYVKKVLQYYQSYVASSQYSAMLVNEL